jgi:chromate reductase
MDKKVRILAFGGSLRKGSYSRALMLEAQKLAPANAEIEVFEINGIPMYNADMEQSIPSAVRDFKAHIKAADAVLIVTPEYNYSIPGFLKNAMDWASRPYPDNSFEDKPAAIISSSSGMLGGSRAQYHLRQSMVYLDMHPINKPECIVAGVAEKIKGGALTDEKTREVIRALLKSLVDWTIRIGKK